MGGHAHHPDTVPTTAVKTALQADYFGVQKHVCDIKINIFDIMTATTAQLQFDGIYLRWLLPQIYIPVFNALAFL